MAKRAKKKNPNAPRAKRSGRPLVRVSFNALGRVVTMLARVTPRLGADAIELTPAHLGGSVRVPRVTLFRNGCPIRLYRIGQPGCNLS